MEIDAQIEWTLERAVGGAEGPDTPPKLAAAIRHAVFPGGARVRPQLCLAVAAACADGEDSDMRLAAAAAGAIELLHCASLVHDDLPCFDDAATRRGKPAVHVAFGEPLGVLAGDSLIITAFEFLADEARVAPLRLPALLKVISCAVGGRSGLVAGQAWESEPAIDLDAYHQSKTAALFVAATTAGAAAMGCDGSDWRKLGVRLGGAYQVADDLRDHVMSSDDLGKPAGQDFLLGRPSAVAEFGVEGALAKLNHLIEDAAESVPDCAGAERLQALVFAQAKRLTPASLAALNV
ncbi:MAG: polyprenyl synthetase family protein [Pseudomonadota bacterium]